jgi:hypothetical protein
VATVQESLNSGDRALADLNHGQPSASTEEDVADVERLQERVDRLTRALIYFHASLVRDRLDRVYLESLDRSNSPFDIRFPAERTSAVVQDELNSLYLEIDDMATMMVDHDHGSALRADLHRIRHAKLRESHLMHERVSKVPIRLAPVNTWLTATLQIKRSLSSLANGTEDLCARAETLKKHKLTLHKLARQLGRLQESRRTDLNPTPSRKELDLSSTTPAAYALYQHFNLSKSSREPNSEALHHPLEQLLQRSDQRSSADLAQILRSARTTSDKTQVSSKNVSNALKTSKEQLDLANMLDHRIAAARHDIEVAQTTTAARYQP